MGQMIRPASTAHNLLVLSAMLLLAAVPLVYWHPVRSALVLMMTGCGGLRFLRVDVRRWSLAVQRAAGARLMLALGFMAAGAYWREGRQLGELRSAFSKYVSADLVDEIVAHPERVKLGGRVRRAHRAVLRSCRLHVRLREAAAAGRGRRHQSLCQRDDESHHETRRHGGQVHRRRRDGFLGRTPRRS